jgi:hypothetical protein
MSKAPSYKRLLLQYEILRARLEIREFFLNAIVKNVYENIGQVLSLVHMQLALLNLHKDSMENITSSGNLVGQSIRDLRNMCHSFYPDIELLKGGGWIGALNTTCKILDPDTEKNIIVSGTLEDIAYNRMLILYGMLQEILTSIYNKNRKLIDISFNYEADKLRCIINYKGVSIQWKEVYCFSAADTLFDYLNLYRRTRLIGGKLNLRKVKSGVNCIIIEIPLNSSLYG